MGFWISLATAWAMYIAAPTVGCDINTACICTSIILAGGLASLKE